MIAEMLNNRFSSLFEKKEVWSLPEFKKRTNSSLGSERILEQMNDEEIDRKLKRLKEDKSTDPDLINPKILLECSSALT